MAVIFNMKFILVWICLFPEVFPFPTKSPTDVNDTTVCCVQNPKLIYKGRDTNRGINIYVFEFLPQSKETKDKRIRGDSSAFKGSETKENHEDTIVLTNKPASMHGKRNDPETDSSTIGTTHMPDLNFDTNNSVISAAQSDIGMYEETDFLSNATEGLQTGVSYTRDVQKTSEQRNGADYYSTEGSAFLDIPGYNDSDTGNQSPQVDFPPNTNDINNNLGCSKSEGQCKNLPKSTERTFVTQPTTSKDLFFSKGRKNKSDGYANRERNTMNHTVKWSMQPEKPNKHKSEKQADFNVDTKDIPVKHNTGKRFQYSRRQRKKTVGNRHSSQYYRSSSSESKSDSSQEFD